MILNWGWPVIFDISIVVCLIAVTFNLILNLRSLKISGKDNKISDPAPFVSVLIPARNEEDNIGACLRTLQEQDYPAFEILVLDDGSTDRTAAIVREMAAADSGIKLIKGEPRPDGWAGKAHACSQLAKQANGSWFLFVDADTRHKPNMISSVLSTAIENKPALLTGFPLQIADSFAGKIAIPTFYFIIMAWLPMWWLHKSKKPKPTLTFGQFLLFTREDYWKIGGHEAVKSRILEDVWIGAEVYRKGGRVLAVDLSRVVSCHMYANTAQMWKGFSKSIYAISSFMLIVLGGIAYFLFLYPFYTAVHHLFEGPTPLIWWWLIIFQLVAIIFKRLLVNNHFKESIYTTLFHPLGLGFFVFEVVYVIYRRYAGLGISWKDRFYKAGGGVD
jgi:chlorobactene glucosyltransferase